MLSLNLKTVKVTTISHTHTKITIQEKTEGITLGSRKTGKSAPSTTEKETMGGYKASFIDSFISLSETDSVQPDDVKSVSDTYSQTNVVITTSSKASATDMSSSGLVPEQSTTDSVSVSPDKPTMTIVSGSHKSVGVQCSSSSPSLTLLTHHRDRMVRMVRLTTDKLQPREMVQQHKGVMLSWHPAQRCGQQRQRPGFTRRMSRTYGRELYHRLSVATRRPCVPQ